MGLQQNEREGHFRLQSCVSKAFIILNELRHGHDIAEAKLMALGAGAKLVRQRLG